MDETMFFGRGYFDHVIYLDPDEVPEVPGIYVTHGDDNHIYVPDDEMSDESDDEMRG